MIVHTKKTCLAKHYIGAKCGNGQNLKANVFWKTNRCLYETIYSWL